MIMSVPEQGDSFTDSEETRAAIRVREGGEQVRIDIVSRVVEGVSREHAIIVRLSGGAQIRIESPFELFEQGLASRVVDPDGADLDDTDFDVTLERALLGRTVADAILGLGNGLLVVTFDDETSLRVPPDPDFEAWSVTHLDGRMVAALPGGAVSQWGPSP